MTSSFTSTGARKISIPIPTSWQAYTMSERQPLTFALRRKRVTFSFIRTYVAESILSPTIITPSPGVSPLLRLISATWAFDETFCRIRCQRKGRERWTSASISRRNMAASLFPSSSFSGGQLALDFHRRLVESY